MIAQLSNWILSIAGVVCLSILIELVLPNGQMNKYIKGIFSFIILLVVISPIPALLGKDISFDGFAGQSDIQVQQEYIQKVNSDKLDAIKQDVDSQILLLGYQNVTTTFDVSWQQSAYQINAVFVDLSGIVISDKSAHTDIMDVKSDIVAVVSLTASVAGERVVFNE